MGKSGIILLALVIGMSPIAGALPAAAADTGSVSGAVMWDNAVTTDGSEIDAPAQAGVLQAYAKLPLIFIRNEGQLDSQVEYYAKTPGQSIYLTPSGMVFDLVRNQNTADSADKQSQRLTFSLDLVGANVSPSVQGIDRDRAVFNYLLGNDPQKWHTDIPAYREVAYKDVYPGIDLRLYGKEGSLEYAFVVQPGADVSDIALVYNGVDGLNTESGELVISTAFGDFNQSQPYIYQPIGDDTVAVAGGFKLLTADSYGFQVGSYDANYPLVIDPSLPLAYSTYLGGSGTDWGYDIAVESGCAYVTGQTYDLEFDPSYFPTKNPYLGNQNVSDAFVTKLDTTKSGEASLIYSTYYGGNGNDVGYGIAVEAGCAYITGETYSTDLPTKRGFQSNHSPDNNCSDIFITRFNTSGNGLVYSSYLGGASSDIGRAIAVEAGNAYVTGVTGSINFPVLNEYQSQFAGAFVARIDTNLSWSASLIYSTYLGGSGAEWGNDIAVESGCAYVTGHTNSTDFPIKNPYQTFEGAVDAFVTKLDTSQAGDDSLIYSTYIGGSYGDAGYGIVVEAGCAYVTGGTGSTDFPTLNPYQGQLKGGGDAFVTRFNASGDDITYSSYLGGNGEDQATGIAVEAGYAYITGSTESTDFPIKNPYQTDSRDYDAFVSKLDTAQSGAASLIYSTYLGGSGDERATGMAVEAGCAYVTGSTGSDDFPTLNQYQTYPGDLNFNVFVAKLNNAFSGSVTAMVTTTDAANIEETTATLNGILNDDGGEACEYRFAWDTDIEEPYAYHTAWADSKHTGEEFFEYVTGLNPGTKYYFRAEAKNSSGTGHGAPWTFTTKPEAPTGFTATAVSPFQIDLSWTKGGAQKTWVCRSSAGYPPTPWDGDQVYFDIGTSYNDTDVWGGTTYYYSAWSQVADMTGEKFSDSYVTATATTLQVVVTTNEATEVHKTTAILNGTLTSDGGEACQYRFEYLPSGSDSWTLTEWTGSVRSGETFSAFITGLARVTKYYFLAEAKNSYGTVYGEELIFTTTPDAPSSFMATAVSPSQIDLSWTKSQVGGTLKTMIRRSTTGYPTALDAGDQVYLDLWGTDTSDTGLTPETTYYYSAWCRLELSDVWSDTYATVQATTPAGMPAPMATTEAATSMQATTVTLNGTLTNDSGEACSYRFEYDTNSGVPYANASPWTGSKTTGQSFLKNITGLNPGTKYYFRAQVLNSYGTGSGAELTFTTRPEAPTDFGAVATTPSLIQLSWVKYGQKTMVRRSTAAYPTAPDAGDQVYFYTGTNVEDWGLTPGTTYYYSAWSWVEGSDIWSDTYDTAQGTTPAGMPAPTVTTEAATYVGVSSACMNGTVTDDGGGACQYRFAYSTTSGGPYWNLDFSTETKTTGQSFMQSLYGLSPGTKYYFRAQAKNSSGPSSGAELTFTTKPISPTGLSVTDIDTSHIDLSWTKGDAAQKTMVRRSDSDYPTAPDAGDQVYFDSGSSLSDTGLTPSTTYYYSVWSWVEGSDIWSDTYTTAQATTSAGMPPPTVTTDSAVSVEETTAILNGTVTNDQGEACQYRFQYDIDSGAPYANATTWTGSKTTGQSFLENITGLNSGTKYYFRAEVKNSAGTGYGAELTFTTKPDPPTGFSVDGISSQMIALSWTKGSGAQKTMVRRSTTGYPVEPDDGDQVFFESQTSIVDTGLTPETTYYYSAWSWVEGSDIWSDTYAIAQATTLIILTVTTDSAANMEETTATLNGTVTNDTGEACEYRFQYDINAGEPYASATAWTGSKTTGQSFSENITGLNPGKTYYFRAEAQNSIGYNFGAELTFTTKPVGPNGFNATPAGASTVNLEWSKGSGAQKTMVRRSTTAYPTAPDAGDQVYFDNRTVTSDTELTTNTTYYYSAWSWVEGSDIWSDTYSTASATTGGVAVMPVAATDAATEIEETTATLNGTITADGGEACQYRFEYDADSGEPYANATAWASNKTTGQSFMENVTGINPGTKYYFRAQAKNDAGPGSGAELTLITKPYAPTDFSAVAVSRSQIDLSWTKGDGAQVTFIYRYYPETDPDAIGDLIYVGTGTSTSDTGLRADSLYHYRAGSAVVEGEDEVDSSETCTAQAMTGPPDIPVVATNAATDVVGTKAILNGTVTDDGGEACHYRFEYDIDSGEPYTYNTGWTGSKTTGESFQADITGLSQGTKYYFRAQAEHTSDPGSGAERTFTIRPAAPTGFEATPVSASQIDLSWSKGNGAQKTMVRRSASVYPTAPDSGDQVYFGTSSSFSDTGRTPETTYYYSAWSWVKGSDVWSATCAEAEATTPEVIPSPTVTTNAASNVEETTATLNGTVADDGGEACTYRFEYDIDSGEPYANATTWTGSKTTGQSFLADITGLSQGTKYYFRADAGNIAGPGYGAELTFTTKPDAPTGFDATAASPSQINLAWTKGSGAQKTMVRRSAIDYPAAPDTGYQVYFDSGNVTSDNGLTFNTTYYYSAWSWVTGSDIWSDDHATAQATTSGELVVPTVTTEAATNVGTSSATLNMTYTLGDYSPVDVRFGYKKSADATWTYTSWASKSASGTHAEPLTGLTSKTEYQFKACLKYDTSEIEGSMLTLTTGPTITVISPNGSETWYIGDSCPITWGSAGITGNVRISISRDGGSTWSVITPTGGIPNTNSYSWTVTGQSTRARIKVSTMATPAVFDTSDANFTIAAGTITVTSPNGGETWYTGDSNNITWDSSHVAGNVKISVSRDGGSTWSVITPTGGIPNTNSYSWAVAGR
jgi:hypothetical protein